MQNLPTSTFMPQFKNEASVDLESGVKVRLYRNEPFKFMNEIHKWLADLKIGEVQAFNMNTDANGWVNFAIAYREAKAPVPAGPDPVLVLYDTVQALRDSVDLIEKIAEKVLDKEERVPAST